MAQKQSKSQTPNISPLGDRVLVQPAEDDGETTTASGIVIPETAQQEKTQQGTVVAVGPGKRDEDGEYIEPAVSEGDTVIFSRYGYDEVQHDQKTYYIVSEANILATIG